MAVLKAFGLDRMYSDELFPNAEGLDQVMAQSSEFARSR
jgi:hypothetical protein